MAGQGFIGQDPFFNNSVFAKKITEKFISLTKTKSTRMSDWMKSNAKDNGMTPGQQAEAAAQGMQDMADDMAMAVYEALQEMNGAIVSKASQDPEFWDYMNKISSTLNDIKSALGIINSGLAGVTTYGWTGGPSLTTALASMNPPPAATQLKSFMEK